MRNCTQLLALLLAFGFVACDDASKEQDNRTAKPGGSATDPSSATGVAGAAGGTGPGTGSGSGIGSGSGSGSGDEISLPGQDRVTIGGEGTGPIDPNNPKVPDQPNGWRTIPTPPGFPTYQDYHSSSVLGPRIFSKDVIVALTGMFGSPIQGPRVADGIIRSYVRSTGVWKEFNPSLPEFHTLWLPILAGKTLFATYSQKPNSAEFATIGKAYDLEAGTARAINMTGVPAGSLATAMAGNERFLVLLHDKVATRGTVYNIANDVWTAFPSADNPFTTNGCTKIDYAATHIVDKTAVVLFQCTRKVLNQDVKETRGDFLDLETMTWTKTNFSALHSLARFTSWPTPYGAAAILRNVPGDFFRLDAIGRTVTKAPEDKFNEHLSNGKKVGAVFDAPSQKILHIIDGVTTPIALDEKIFGTSTKKEKMSVWASDRLIIVWSFTRSDFYGYPILNPTGASGTIAGSADTYIHETAAAVYDVAKQVWTELPVVNRPVANMGFSVWDFDEVNDELTVFAGGQRNPGEYWGFMDGGSISLKDLKPQARQCWHVKEDLIHHASEVMKTARKGCQVRADCNAWHVKGWPVFDSHFPVTVSKVTTDQRAKLDALVKEGEDKCGEPIFEENSVPASLRVDCGWGECQIPFDL